MSTAGLSKRFLETTRGRIVALLRRSSRTVEELAQALGLTDNAIRSHLSTLERDGLVRQDGVRRGAGAGKPAVVYEVHPEAEPLFSRAYAPVLGALLAELTDHLSAEQREEVMRAAGRRLAAGAPRPPSDDLEARLRTAVALLEALGGEVEVEWRDGAPVIRGCGCPLAAATSRHPEVCVAVEALMEEILGVPVREHCERGTRPRCRFEATAAPAAPGPTSSSTPSSPGASA